MRKQLLISAIVVPTLLASAVWAQNAGGVQSLRGADVDEPVAVEDVFHQDKDRFTRNYRQQPPLIPHSIEKYQIDLKANRCLSCHDWTNAGERNAPTLSMTHYQDRAGNQLDVVAGTRWFCNQCHVPQVDAPALVENTFEASN
ncbi:nitrate reductase cytochrome c-type subunit [Aliiroseovarius crassostreae]|uniref:nitrate reductase cytochrome c-type subunit n=1 Tax=Aliiroseovarius crassostreae TaxID=154981 RepID=UPI002208880C|nr:nitrate reductase cytochrome c-type subunit [Aliiroseovarius crassostreae]UWP97661.1 nitrate reductase cytochrome c-type subunit [Aliiroseovarius crassostreae]